MPPVGYAETTGEYTIHGFFADLAIAAIVHAQLQQGVPEANIWRPEAGDDDSITLTHSQLKDTEIAVGHLEDIFRGTFHVGTRRFAAKAAALGLLLRIELSRAEPRVAIALPLQCRDERVEQKPQYEQPADYLTGLKRAM